ncbi:MAG: glycerol transporter [Claussenomyces sp. TS43310]|nr:MAG: glycerol transporter [Claussenomyces sp. TS43310]
MSLFSYVRRVYALDTIDTRFTTSSSTPFKAIDSRIDPAKCTAARDEPLQGVPMHKGSKGQPVAEPSKWATPEFYFYYFIFIIAVPYMFWVAYDVSRPSDPRYHKYEDLLSDGWVPERKIDVSDSQYSTFRENIPYMSILVICHPLFRRFYNTLRPLSKTRAVQNGQANGTNAHHISAAEAEARLDQRATFDFGFALIFLTALHGFSALKVVSILYLNFCIATRLPKQHVPIMTWAFNVGILFANELCAGYHFASIVEFMSPTGQEGAEKMPNWGTWMDSHGGIMPRWEILFNITVLRLISFNMDYYWSLDRRAASPMEKKQLDPANLSERDRISLPADTKDYSFRNYIAYILYGPLYLTGPIITFNDYISQLKYISPSIETSRTIKYAIRFLLTLLSMELVLHFDYCVAISKADPNWSDYSPAQLSLLSYFNLHVIWLKLLIPWRFFRLWALMDGIDPPENMVRCVSNNPSTLAFWRGWHRSFNRWLIRYLYIPLGGSTIRGRYAMARSALNYLLTFTFVALWHDISLNLLAWGWLIVFFMLPEVLAGYLFPRKNFAARPTAYRCLCAVGAVGNIMMMMMANLVGFAVGVDGLKSIIYGVFHDFSGMAFLVTACSALFVGVQVMYEIRESEMRQGIFMKC